MLCVIYKQHLVIKSFNYTLLSAHQILSIGMAQVRNKGYSNYTSFLTRRKALFNGCILFRMKKQTGYIKIEVVFLITEKQYIYLRLFLKPVYYLLANVFLLFFL